MARSLESYVPFDLLSNFQIFVSRVTEPLNPDKVRILWLHDLPGDPASDHLKNGGWKKFHILVAVSHWQQQAYESHYQIPPSRFIVLQNAINPIRDHVKPDDKISLAYWSTPHRGLEILYPVFDRLSKEFDNIELNVFSSFNLYKWPERDAPYENLFQSCREHPKINYHGTVSNHDVREAILENHILAYPSIWPETSCLTLIEAMSGGMACVHSSLAALPETASNWTWMYGYNEDSNKHMSIFYSVLKHVIENLNAQNTQGQVLAQKQYIDHFYSWERRANQWINLLESTKDLNPKLGMDDSRKFVYNT